MPVPPPLSHLILPIICGVSKKGAKPKLRDANNGKIKGKRLNIS